MEYGKGWHDGFLYAVECVKRGDQIDHLSTEDALRMSKWAEDEHIILEENVRGLDHVLSSY